VDNPQEVQDLISQIPQFPGHLRWHQLDAARDAAELRTLDARLFLVQLHYPSPHRLEAKVQLWSHFLTPDQVWFLTVCLALTRSVVH
jgi:hypothetical protein